MREVIEVIKCDMCKAEVKQESDLTTHTFAWDRINYELELDEQCEENVLGHPLDTLIQCARKVPVKKGGTKSPSPGKPAPSTSNEGAYIGDFLDPESGRYECARAGIDPTCRFHTTKQQGMRMHLTRSKHTVPKS